jgi:FkbM family methyltransferase
MTDSRTFLGAESLRRIYAEVGRERLGPVCEEIVQAIYTATLRRGDACVDGGAYAGRHTIPMARVCAPGLVHAFEPLPDRITGLGQALQASPARNVRVHPVALADECGEREFAYYPGAPSYSGLRARWTPGATAAEPITVPVRTIDSAVGPDERVAFVKLDLEGGEFDALRGAGRVLADCRPIVAFETDRDKDGVLYGYEPGEFFDLFRRHGYRLRDCFGTEMEPAAWMSGACWTPWYWIALPQETALVEAVTDAIACVTDRHGLDLPLRAPE